MLYLLLLILPLYSSALLIEQEAKMPASHSYVYKFYDLAEVDIPIEQLSKYHLPNTLAPRINDQRELTYNQANQSLISNLTGCSLAPHFSALKGHCHGLGNQGGLLLSFARTQADVLWSLWQQERMHPKRKVYFDNKGLAGGNIFLRSLNATNTAVGSFKPSGALRPLIWTPNSGLQHLGSYLGRDIQGVAWDVNSQGTVIGSEFIEGYATPFVWNAKWGFLRLDDLPYRWEQITKAPLDGHIHFADSLIGDDDLFYGTFYLQREGKQVSPYYAFWWNPRTAEVRALNFKGMRLNALAGNTFVGQWHGLAALCDLGRAPILLTELFSSIPADWELISATDINQHGDIIGYGKRGECMRYFALKRTNIANAP